MKKRKITPQRLERITQQVGPLLVQGWGCRRISTELGISKQQALEDMRACQELWKETHQDSRDLWQGRLLAQYEWMLGECAQAWAQSKQGRVTRIINPDGTELIRQEPPDPRWLSGMLAVAKETSTFLGIREGADTVARMEVPESTKQALAPMSPDAYMAMLATTGGLSAVNAVPPTQRREGDDAVPVECLEQQGETADECLPLLGETPSTTITQDCGIEDESGSQLPKQPRFVHPRLAV